MDSESHRILSHIRCASWVRQHSARVQSGMSGVHSWEEACGSYIPSCTVVETLQLQGNLTGATPQSGLSPHLGIYQRALSPNHGAHNDRKRGLRCEVKVFFDFSSPWTYLAFSQVWDLREQFPDATFTFKPMLVSYRHSKEQIYV